MGNTEGREGRVPLARLWRRTSKAGGVYFGGSLGRARLLAFPSTDAEGVPVLDLVAVPGEPRERTAPGDAPGGTRDRGAPEEAPRERDGDGIPF